MSEAAQARPMPRRGRKTIIKRLLLVALAIVLAIGGYLGYEAYRVYQGVSHIMGVSQPHDTGEPGYAHPGKVVPLPAINGNQPFNVLVLGSDNDKKTEEKQPLTQSMIVVRVDPVAHTVGMLSIPRDFWVPIPGHGYGKIDLAAKYGWVSLARDTVERLFNIHIDYYAWVGLSGFRKVVDTFHGITIDVQHPILDDYYPDDQKPGDPYAFTRLFLPPGWRHLSGRQALEYVRSRHGDAIGDFGRSERQQQVLLALRRKADVMNVIENLPAVLDDLQGSVLTDVKPVQLYQLEELSRHIDTNSIHRLVLQAPTYCNYGWATNSLGRQSVLFPRWKVIRPAVYALFHPRKPAAAKPTARPVATAKPAGRTTATPGPTAKPAPSPVPTPAPPSFNRLPGTLVFEREGNIFELTPDRHTVQIYNQNAAAMPALSPDGKTIAFVRFSTPYASDIWLVNTHTHRAHALTSNANADVHNNLWAAWPAWAPDGKSLIISSDRAKLTQPESESRPIDLSVWTQPLSSAAGTQITVPFTGNGGLTSGAGGDIDASWRPHSNQILYVHWAYDQANRLYSQLMLRDITTGATRALTPPSGRTLQPEFDRSGHNIVFVQGNGSISQVVVAAVNDTANGPQLGRQTIVAQGEVAQPAFTPGGQWVSYLQAAGDGFSLQIVRSSGGASSSISELGTDMDAISRPVWTPAG